MSWCTLGLHLHHQSFSTSVVSLTADVKRPAFDLSEVQSTSQRLTKVLSQTGAEDAHTEGSGGSSTVEESVQHPPTIEEHICAASLRGLVTEVESITSEECIRELIIIAFEELNCQRDAVGEGRALSQHLAKQAMEALEAIIELLNGQEKRLAPTGSLPTLRIMGRKHRREDNLRLQKLG